MDSSSNRTPHRLTQDLAEMAVLAAIYFGAGKLGLSLAFLHTNVSPVWPPTGVALAAIWLLGYRIAPAIWVGALLANLATPVTGATACAIATGNSVKTKKMSIAGATNTYPANACLRSAS